MTSSLVELLSPSSTSLALYILQCGNHSKSFPILQGVRQGAILSPLLYSIFVDDLLNTLDHSGLGARIGEVFCGAPMYADDLALVASSPEELQAMLDIVSHYASQWRYRLNSSKSVILVFGEYLHPVTSYRLYSTLSLPIMLYGCELWSISKAESLMLECVHRKILRTIQGLPVRCPSVALISLLGHIFVHISAATHLYQLHHIHVHY